MEDIFGMLIFLGKTLLCLRFVPLLFWECMPYVICSVPCMIRCNIGIIHVLPKMLYSLAYCGLLLLSLVGLAVCGWFRLILPAVVICPTTVGGSIYLLCIFLLWNGFECLDVSLCIVFPVITWGNHLVLDVYGCHCHLKSCQWFIVHEVESWVDYTNI